MPEMSMRNRITEMCKIEYPIIQGGMHYVGYAEVNGGVGASEWSVARGYE
jgi:NAD(P)H-dependent flavin oxidoreductase YrpB (nitropropane dioxygenase family)